jgi:hypothetical protein
MHSSLVLAVKKVLVSRAVALVIATLFFTLAAFHFVPAVRYGAQAALVRMNPSLHELIVYVVGEPFILHDASTPVTLAVSMGHRLPTRYARDVLYWHGFKDGDNFAAEGTTDRFGVRYIFFERDTARRQQFLSTPSKVAVCVGKIRAWVARMEGMKESPVYYLDSSDYIASFVTDGSERWKDVERRCPDNQ